MNTGDVTFDPRWCQTLVEALEDVISETPCIAPEITFVAARIDDGQWCTVLVRAEVDGPVLGRRWRLTSLSRRQGTSDPIDLASAAWGSEIAEPGGPEIDGESEWAAGLVPSPQDVAWVAIDA
ncbi:hypothetical protein KLP28_02580 [Nocardioidaceae bacterium]|nr:hypothetical protein KLP28_02580 [Nocardioidaceae bacterium]